MRSSKQLAELVESFGLVFDVDTVAPPPDAGPHDGSPWLTLAQPLRDGDLVEHACGRAGVARFAGHLLAVGPEARQGQGDGDAVGMLDVELRTDDQVVLACFGPWRFAHGYGEARATAVCSGELQLSIDLGPPGLYLLAVGSPQARDDGVRYSLRVRDPDGGHFGARVPRFAAPEVRGEGHRALDEASGLAASRDQNGVLWAHTDRPGEAKLFALDARGDLLAELRLRGLQVRDCEDIAVGATPGAEGWSLYLGDIGDNRQRRDSVRVLRLREPRVEPRRGRLSVDAADIEVIELTYPPLMQTGARSADEPGGAKGERTKDKKGRKKDKKGRKKDKKDKGKKKREANDTRASAHDAEALMIDPLTGDLYIVTKALKGERLAHVMRARAPLGSGLLEHVGTLELGSGALAGVRRKRITGGDISACGDELVLRTREDALIWRRPAGCDWPRALACAPWIVRLRGEAQGEAITYGPDDALFTLSEMREPLRFLARLPHDADDGAD